MDYYGESFENLARKAEKFSDWSNAEYYWNLAKRFEDANACKMIREAIELGDEYRRRVGDAHERWENHEINNSQLYEIQCQAHAKVYGK
jgi:hypothetical protein